MSILKDFKPKTIHYTPRTETDIQVIGNIQVSRGEYSFKNMVVVLANKPKQCYLIQYNEEIPTVSRWIDKSVFATHDFSVEVIDVVLGTTIAEAIGMFKEEEHRSHLNPYSYIYGVVLANTGIRLHNLWSFKVVEE